MEVVAVVIHFTVFGGDGGGGGGGSSIQRPRVEKICENERRK